MARGIRRLGALLTLRDGDGDSPLVEAVELLASVPSPRGAERPLAEAVVSYARDVWPDVRWQVDQVDGPDCAQVVGVVGAPTDDRPGPLICSHLDTSLTGTEAFDGSVTGAPAPAGGVVVDLGGRTLTGFGLGVAKAPAAAALVAFGRAAARIGAGGPPARILLAARGTHRAPFGRVGEPVGAPVITGVERFLGTGPRPTSALLAKGGPAGVLHEEPGAAYVRVVARSGWGAVMARDAVRPPGGVLAHLGDLVAAVTQVGDGIARLLAERAPSGQAGACFGIGAVRGGQAAKADLVPGVVELAGYLVAPGVLERERVRHVFGTALREALEGVAGVDVEVDVIAVHDGAATSVGAAVVQAATRAWATESKEHGVLRGPQEVTGWTGSTDGVVLRAAGIPTARLGPSRTRADGVVDVVDLDELVAFARVYERALGELVDVPVDRS